MLAIQASTKVSLPSPRGLKFEEDAGLLESPHSQKLGTWDFGTSTCSTGLGKYIVGYLGPGCSLFRISNHNQGPRNVSYLKTNI